MLRNAVQLLVVFALLGTAVCPCLAQSLLIEQGSHHSHSGGQHHANADSLPECHGGNSEAACVGVNSTLGGAADSITGSVFQFEDEDAGAASVFESSQPDLTHHGGSPPTTDILIAGSPVTLHDRLIE